MEKSRLLLFLFSFMPGAGQMYLGMMKKGVCFMTLFCGIFSFTILFRLEFVLFLLPIVWFYSFFDSFNSGHFTYEERMVQDADFFFDLSGFLGEHLDGILAKRHVFIGAASIFLGVYILLNHVLRSWIYCLDEFVPGLAATVIGIFNKLPTCVIAIIIIWWGIRLMKGETKSTSLPAADFKEFEGEHHE